VVCGSSIELRMTTGALRMAGWVVEDGGLGTLRMTAGLLRVTVGGRKAIGS
jgi:hypothetical protein